MLKYHLEAEVNHEDLFNFFSDMEECSSMYNVPVIAKNYIDKKTNDIVFVNYISLETIDGEKDCFRFQISYVIGKNGIYKVIVDKTLVLDPLKENDPDEVNAFMGFPEYIDKIFKPSEIKSVV